MNYEFIDYGIKKESDCSGESDDKISERMNYEFIDYGIKKESDCSGESDDKISEKVNYEFIDYGIKKESDCSGESDDKIYERVNYESIDPDVRKENECSAIGNIKSERSTDDSFDIKYEDFEYDTNCHTLSRRLYYTPKWCLSSYLYTKHG